MRVLSCPLSFLSSAYKARAVALSWVDNCQTAGCVSTLTAMHVSMLTFLLSHSSHCVPPVTAATRQHRLDGTSGICPAARITSMKRQILFYLFVM